MQHEPAPAPKLTVARFLDTYGHVALTIGPDESVVDACTHFGETVEGRKYSMAVVVDHDRRVVGVLSLGDIVYALRSFGAEVVNKRVADIMSTNVVTTTPDESLVGALKLMTQHHIRHMPVIKDGILEGLVTDKEALEGLYDQAEFDLRLVTGFMFRSGARY